MASASSPDDPVTGREEKAFSMEVAGDSALARDDLSEALSCWKEALDILASHGSCDAAARVASKLAMTEEGLGETEDACLHYRKAADCYEEAGETRRVPMCLNNLAMLHKMSGDLEEASVLLDRALMLAARCHGPVHGETALIATNLGAVLCERGDLLGAEQRHMQALGIREQLFGATHPEVGLSLGHLGVIHQLRGDDKRARSFYSAALAILQEFPGLHDAERAVLQENLDEL